MTPRIWQARGFDERQAGTLERELGLAPVTARLLSIRGLGEVDDARRFLNPAIADLHDPFRLRDMGPAVDRILGAIVRRLRQEHFRRKRKALHPITRLKILH